MKQLLTIFLLFCCTHLHAQTPCDSSTHVRTKHLYFADSIKDYCNGCKLHFTKTLNKTTVIISPAVVPKNKTDTTTKKKQ
jgi:hypothetical protein